MAEKRMFAKSIVLTDAFLDMPMSARCLYFTLSMVADDDGFVGSPKSVMRQCGASQDDMKVLIVKRFVLAFDSGVIVIKHWRINNYLQKDRYNPTTYQEELATLKLDQKNAYTERDKAAYTECIQDVYTDKNSIDKSNTKEKVNQKEKQSGVYKFIPPTIDEIKAYCDERNSSVDPESFYSFYESKGWMIGKNKMKNWKMAISTWERKDANYVSNREEQKREENDKKKGLVHIDDWTKVDKDGNYHPEW